MRSVVSGGAFNYFVVKSDGTLLAWGDNDRGILGKDDVTYIETPFDAVKIMERVKSVSTSQYSSFAIDEDNCLWAWGVNFNGIFDEFSDREYGFSPAKIINDVADISAGNTILMLKSNGELWGWGAYYYGQLGDGRYNKYLVDGEGAFNDYPTFDTQYEKSPIKIMDNVRYILAGGNSCFAVKNDGSLWAWGCNKKGELGDGTTISRSYPVKIMDNVSFVAEGCYAIKDDGSLWTWGLVGAGDGSKRLKEENLLPQKIMDDVMFASKFYGGQSVAIKRDGSFLTWGSNDFGQLGDGTTTSRFEPVKIMDDVVYSAGNYCSTLALKNDGSLWLMGMHTGSDVQLYSPYKVMDDVMLPEPITFYD